MLINRRNELGNFVSKLYDVSPAKNQTPKCACRSALSGFLEAGSCESAKASKEQGSRPNDLNFLWRHPMLLEDYRHCEMLLSSNTPQ